jgi:hypothetical protein
MKLNLVPRTVELIMKELRLDSTERDDVEVLVRKIIKKVRYDYLIELKSDLENTINNVFGVGK